MMHRVFWWFICALVCMLGFVSRVLWVPLGGGGLSLWVCSPGDVRIPLRAGGYYSKGGVMCLGHANEVGCAGGMRCQAACPHHMWAGVARSARHCRSRTPPEPPPPLSAPRPTPLASCRLFACRADNNIMTHRGLWEGHGCVYFMVNGQQFCNPPPPLILRQAPQPAQR